MSHELTVKEIASAMIACRANARELLQEADILLELGHQARAFALRHTAIEELAKFFIFELAGKRVSRSNPPNWKRFWQRLRAHDSKIAQARLRVLQVLTEATEANDIEGAVAGAEMLFNAGLVPRNAGLYVELSPEGSFRKPSDIDWRVGLEALQSLAVLLLKNTDAAGFVSSAIEETLLKPSRDLDRVQTEALFLSVLTMCRNAGVTEEKMRKIVISSFGKSK